MRRRIVIPLVITAVMWTSRLVMGGPVAGPALSGLTRDVLLDRLKTAWTVQAPTTAREPVYAPELLSRFYAQRQYEPAWCDGNGLLPQVEVFIQVLREAPAEGLDPRDYHLVTIDALVEEIPRDDEQQVELDPDRLADLELLLSDAFLTYGAHLLVGRMNPNVHRLSQAADHTGVNLVYLLHQALATGRVREALHSLISPHAGYARLRQALARYRQIASAEGWPEIKAGPSLHQGDQDERVVALRARLGITGDLDGLPEYGAKPVSVDADRFDETLEQAVRTFQQRHGLDVDGVVGEATRAALNVPAEARVQQIALNMERWRWRSREFGWRYIQVNIPAFRLDVIEQEQSVLTMRVVVGKPHQRTPVLSGTMAYLVLNPYWQVPRSIARREIFPRLLLEPGYLATNNMKLFQGWDVNAPEIDPQAIDWSVMSAKNFRYRVRQEPGPQNALGRMKFIFSNPYNIYLHDTPSRSLFTKTVRAFSHGCIRLQKPLALAEYLLQGETHWTREAILKTLEKGDNRYVPLSESIPVYLVYRTAWVDSEGTVQFRPDIYQHDQRQKTSFCGVTPTMHLCQTHPADFS